MELILSQSAELLRRLLRSKDRMDAAPNEEWPIYRLADISAVSTAHFAREFRKAFGVPPHRYLLTRRIERATALLRDTALPITEISLQTGWNSIGTFGRIFRDITGHSPGEFRSRATLASHERVHIPECLMRTTGRPELNIAVLEKRRRQAAGKLDP